MLFIYDKKAAHLVLERNPTLPIDTMECLKTIPTS